jgi:hypothetical protein
MLLLLDQLGEIWEITSWVTMPKALPTGMKRSFRTGLLPFSVVGGRTGLGLQAGGQEFESP